MSYNSRTYDVSFWPYLTPANLRRWQGLFDEMEASTAALPTELGNVRRLRRNLDLATLLTWLDHGGEPVAGLRSDEVDLLLVDRVILVKHEAA